MTNSKADSLISVRNLDGTAGHAGDPLQHGPETFSPETFGPEQIGPGKKVSLHFALTLENGELIDSCFDKAPATFTVGDGSMLPGFERALFGMRAGEKLDCRLPPQAAFGNYNADNVQTFPRYRFPADLLLNQGLMIDFSDTAGNTQAGMVKSFDSSSVEIDFNHPLADRHIGFRAHIASVEASVSTQTA